MRATTVAGGAAFVAGLGVIGMLCGRTPIPPPDRKGGIFISYRHAEASAFAGDLALRLKSNFGDGEVYTDGGIKGGDEWRKSIARALEDCDTGLVVIGRDWVNHIQEPDDFVASEVERMLERRARDGVLVIPILIDGAPVLKADKLPRSLSVLADLQASRMSTPATPPEFAEHIDTLVPHRRPWKRVIVDEEGSSDAMWMDIWWPDLKDRQGWLGGFIASKGFLMMSQDAGKSWRAAGDFRGTEGPGPIRALRFYRDPEGAVHRGLVATDSGIYYAEGKEGTLDERTPWKQILATAAPINNVAPLEGLAEIYAVGWPGILRGEPGAGGGWRWKTEKPTCTYDISSVDVTNGRADRSVWAVGRAGEGDTLGKRDSQSHGALYRSSSPGAWEMVDLRGVVDFTETQNLTDVLVINSTNVFAVGYHGLVIKGTQHGRDPWIWRRLEVPASSILWSIANSRWGLWIVGDGGTVLNSLDGGDHWARLPMPDPIARRSLKRVRFTERGQGWILGEAAIMRSVWPGSAPDEALTK